MEINELPKMHPQERLDLEKKAGRKFKDDQEAHEYRKMIVTDTSIRRLLKEKGIGNDSGMHSYKR